MAPYQNGDTPVNPTTNSPTRRRGRWPLLMLPVFGVILLLSAVGCDSDAHQSILAPTPWSLEGAKGPGSARTAALFNVLLWTMVVVFVLIEGALLYAAVRFRRRPGDPLPPQTHGHTPLKSPGPSFPPS